jgi:hypothetical protein
MSDADMEELKKLRRRVDQLQTELRVTRGGGDKAKKFEDIQNELEKVKDERDKLKAQVADLEKLRETDAADVKVQKADEVQTQATEIVSGLNDLLSDLRINVLAAQGEFEQFADKLPRASFELIREALRTCATEMENARELLRKLRGIAK